MEGESVADADREVAEFSEYACDGVEEGGYGFGYMRRGDNPRESGILPSHRAMPALHGNDRKAAFASTLLCACAGLGGRHVFFIKHDCQLAAGLTIYIWNTELRDKGEESFFDIRAFYLLSAEGVGAVEDDEFFVVFSACFHQVAECRDIGERAAADILNVVHENVDGVEHLAGRFAIFTEERVHGDAGFGVHLRLYGIACVNVAAHAVLRSEESHEIDFGRLVEDVNSGFETMVNTCRIGAESDTFALETVEMAVTKDFYACFDG